MVVDFKNLDMQTDSIAGIFRQCIRVCNIHILNLDTSNIVNMSYMFYGCKRLKELDLSRFNIQGNVAMESMFEDCYDLVKLDISSFNLRIHGDCYTVNTFFGCLDLEEIKLPKDTVSRKVFIEALDIDFVRCKII